MQMRCALGSGGGKYWQRRNCTIETIALPSYSYTSSAHLLVYDPPLANFRLLTPYPFFTRFVPFTQRFTEREVEGFFKGYLRGF